jgi:hypothetical protein
MYRQKIEIIRECSLISYFYQSLRKREDHANVYTLSGISDEEDDNQAGFVGPVKYILNSHVESLKRDLID